MTEPPEICKFALFATWPLGMSPYTLRSGDPMQNGTPPTHQYTQLSDNPGTD